MSVYKAWLIHAKDGTVTKYYGLLQEHNDWTTDPEAALHFGRSIDAKALINFYGWKHCEAVEHVWYKPHE